MSKHIIELNEDCKIVQQMCVTEHGNAYTDGCYSCDLEELNSDYINEHFGSLQDEAYKRGINDGSLDVKQRVEGAYQKGFEDGKKSTEKGCEGCKYVGVEEDAPPCRSCSKSFLDRYEPAPPSDRIEVGDIVERYIDGKLDSKGIYLQEEDGYWRCLFDTGAILMTFAYPKEQFKKTGKHCDIQSILEAMRT